MKVPVDRHTSSPPDSVPQAAGIMMDSVGGWRVSEANKAQTLIAY
jgi:hypothetical protein